MTWNLLQIYFCQCCPFWHGLDRLLISLQIVLCKLPFNIKCLKITLHNLFSCHERSSPTVLTPAAMSAFFFFQQVLLLHSTNPKTPLGNSWEYMTWSYMSPINPSNLYRMFYLPRRLYKTIWSSSSDHLWKESCEKVTFANVAYTNDLKSTCFWKCYC